MKLSQLRSAGTDHHKENFSSEPLAQDSLQTGKARHDNNSSKVLSKLNKIQCLSLNKIHKQNSPYKVNIQHHRKIDKQILIIIIMSTGIKIFQISFIIDHLNL